MWIPPEKSRKYLVDVLRLPATGQEQDWDVELSDFKRIAEFIEFYEKTKLKPDDKRAMVSLILNSFEDSYWAGSIIDADWNRFCDIVMIDFNVVQDVFEEWLADDLDSFGISSKIRDLVRLANSPLRTG